MPPASHLHEDAHGLVTTEQAADYLDTTVQNIVGRFHSKAIEGEQPGGKGTTILLKADSVRAYREKGGRRRGPKRPPRDLDLGALQSVLERIEGRLARLEVAVSEPLGATDSQTALVVGLLGVNEELRGVVEASDEVAIHLADAVKASLSAKAAMTSADKLRDEIVLQFAITDDLITKKS